MNYAWKPADAEGPEVAVTYRILRLPGVPEDVFRATLVNDVLPAASVPGLNRALNRNRQRLSKVVGGTGPDTWLWTVEWVGVPSAKPGNAEKSTAEMLNSVRDRLERVGLVLSQETTIEPVEWTPEPV